jgi:hypothetical protein
MEYTADANGRGFYSCLTTGLFATLQEAGIAAVNCINGQSIYYGMEYGGNIYYITQNGKYSFTAPVAGGPASVDIPDTVPNGTTMEGDYHTHGAYDPAYDNEVFSTADVSSNNAGGYPGFLGTPGGRIEVYRPTDILRFPWGCVLVGSPVPGVPKCP